MVEALEAARLRAGLPGLSGAEAEAGAGRVAEERGSADVGRREAEGEDGTEFTPVVSESSWRAPTMARVPEIATA